MARLAVGKDLDVLQGVAPLVGHQLHVDAPLVQLLGQTGQSHHLGLAVAVAVHGALNAQVEGLGGLLQGGQIVGHLLVVVVAEGRADGAVHVDVQDGGVAGIDPLGLDAVAQPRDVLQQLAAVAAQLGVDVVDEGVGQDLSALDDHLVGVVVAVVAGLGEDGDGGIGYGAAVLVRHHFAHEAAGGAGHGVQDGLADAVADGGVQALALHLNGLHHLAETTEVVGLLAHQLGLDVLVDDGDEVLGQEQGVTPARAGVLDRRAVAVGHLTVLQDDHHRDGLPRLPHGLEALGDRLACVKHAVVTCAGLDGALVVEVEAGPAGGADNVNNFHGKHAPLIKF